jgi:hypothetical protein
MSIEKGVHQTLDVFAIGERANSWWPSTLEHPRPIPSRMSGKWFRMDVKITGDESAAADIALKVKIWRGMERLHSAEGVTHAESSAVHHAGRYL